jgi:general stress protein YciG
MDCGMNCPIHLTDLFRRTAKTAVAHILIAFSGKFNYYHYKNFRIMEDTRFQQATPGTQEQKSKHSKRGFASMDPEQQRAISREGGKAAHQQGVAHKFTSEEARAAGKKGGEAVSKNREHMAAIGRKGGTNRGKKKSTVEENNQQ